MKTHWAWLLMLPMLAWLTPAASTRAQTFAPPPYGGGGGAPGPGWQMPPGPGYAAPAQYYDQGSVVGGGVQGGEVYGDGGVYGGEMYGGEYFDEYGGNGGGFSAMADRVGNVLGFLGPCPNGGICAPRWFDFRVEFMTMDRATSDNGIGLVSDGPSGLGDPFIVLSSNSANTNVATGVRFTSTFMLGAAGHLEFGYMGGFNWAGQSSVSSADDALYSVFSDFGNVPPPSATQIPFNADYDLLLVTRGGYTDTDSAEFASVEQSGELYSFELGYRRRWQGLNCRFQGSWLIGTRFMRVSEQFIHRTVVDYPNPSIFIPIVQNPGPEPILDPITGSMTYNIGTSNNMTGLQVGGDLWACLIPGIRVGVDLKAGVYGNRATQVSSIIADSLAAPINEKADEDRATFHLELGVMGEYRFTEYFTLTGGVYGMWFDGMALADQNFNTGSPFMAGARTVGLNKNSDLFLSGATVGLEYMW